MSIRRVVPDISSERVDESRRSYTGVLGFELVMDLGFVMAFASPTSPKTQVTVVGFEMPRGSIGADGLLEL
jgi:catechol 2,3-dioxygenase-like lactoylglutathione lyase family enzyme